MTELMKMFSSLNDIKELNDLISEANLVKSEDGSLEFKNENAHLKFNQTDNGMSLSYSYESPKKDDKKAFTDLCDTFDDEFFNAACERYSEAYGNGSLNELNKNLTRENQEEFIKFALLEANEQIETLSNYKNNIECWLTDK